MNKFYHRLLTVITFLFSNISAANAESVWALVTDASELKAGDQVIITARNYNYAIGTEADPTNNIRLQAILIEKQGKFCAINESVQIFTIQRGDSYFQFKTDKGYLATEDHKDMPLGFNTSSSNKYTKWSVSIDITGKATIISNQGRIRYYISNKGYFKCYTNEGQNHDDVVIYKLTDTESIKDCIVTLSIDGMEETKALKVGSSYTLPSEVPEAEGLDFVGWSTTPFPIGTTKTPELNDPGETVTIDNTITYYAVYAKKEVVREPTYIKVESEPSDWSGTYLIVCESESVAFNGSLNYIDVANNCKNVHISDNQIVSNAETDAMAFYINTIQDGYSVQSENGIFIGITDGENHIETSPTKAILNIISYNDNNGVYIKGTSSVKNYAIRYNNKDCRFRYYMYSNNLPIQLYKLNQTSSAYTYYTTSLNIEVTANNYGYSTWYSTVPVNIPEGLNAYYCTIEENATATLHPIHGIIPSSTAAILYSPETATTQSSKTYTLSYTNATTQNVSGNHLIGYTEDTEVNNGVSHYALNALNGIVGFYVPKTAIGDNPTPESAFIAKAGKAYLSINPNEAPISYAIKRVDETDINPTIETMPRCEMQIYDLFGRPAKHAGKGIYITNGKKVFF